jgi:uncharacterized protein
MLASSALVATERRTHYLKRLCEHFARERGRHGAPEVKVRFDEYEGYVDFAPIVRGSCRLNARNEGLLVLSATGADQEALAAVQRILSEHVERFGRREGLSADWGPASEVASPD